MKKVFYTFIFLAVSLLCAFSQKTFTIVIDPGHGGRDAGAVGAISKEKNINLSVALKLGSMIENTHQDVQVVYTRKKDVFIALDERANIANRYKADLFVSIHVNSLSTRKNKGAANVTGAETYTMGLASSEENLDVAMRENSVITMEDDYKQKYEGFDPKSTESYIIFEFMQNKHLEQSVSFASQIQKSFVRTGRKNRGVRQAHFLVLRKTGMPSVLVELGYISNRNEERYLASEEGQRKLARAIYDAFCNYKDDYDRKLGNIKEKRVVTREEAEKNRQAVSSGKTASASGKKTTGKTTTSTSANKASSASGVTYRIQILTSGKKLATNDKRFKGYKNISYYQENGIYKYTYGNTSDFALIRRQFKQVSKDFKDAFIIKMKNGERIK